LVGAAVGDFLLPVAFVEFANGEVGGNVFVLGEEVAEESQQEWVLEDFEERSIVGGEVEQGMSRILCR
jgi:hypothetical protein